MENYFYFADQFRLVQINRRDEILTAYSSYATQYVALVLNTIMLNTALYLFVRRVWRTYVMCVRQLYRNNKMNLDNRYYYHLQITYFLTVTT